jgi:hypothetical protein
MWKIKKALSALEKGQLKMWIDPVLQAKQKEAEERRIAEAVAAARAEASAPSVPSFIARMLG